MTVVEAIRYGTKLLAGAGIDNAAYEARLLLAHVMQIDQTGLLSRRDQLSDLSAYSAFLDRRVAREPIAYILGQQGFWTLDLAVSSATLIPRADSETLVEAAKALPGPIRSILDLGTGTGCLLLAVLTVFPSAQGIGVDRNPAAAALAARNAVTTGLSDRTLFVTGNWATAINARFDLVISNPPYIRRGDFGDLMPEVAEHEPRLALDGGPDGLDAYRRIVAALPALLAPNGQAILEIGATQFTDVARLAKSHGFQVTSKRDLSGHERAAMLSHPR